MYEMIFIIFTFKVGNSRAKNVKNGNVTANRGTVKVFTSGNPQKTHMGGFLGGSWGFPDMTTLTVYPL